MLYIAHRGNITGPNPEAENHPEYLMDAIEKGYSVEADFWVHDGSLWLGHDEPTHLVLTEWESGSLIAEIRLKSSRVFCHAKNLDALIYLNNAGAHCFFHDVDDYVITNKGVIWTHPRSPLVSELTDTAEIVAVMPEAGQAGIAELRACHGICTDHPEQYRGWIEA